MERRFDPENHLPELRKIRAQLDTLPTVALGELTQLCYRYPGFYGIEYQPSGVLILKGENISRDGEVVVREGANFITEEVNARFPKTQLQAGDLIISVRGEVGKVGLITPELAGANINANTIRIALHPTDIENRIDPVFLWVYLNSSVGQHQIKQFIAGGVQQTITAPELLQAKVPLLPLPFQQKLVVAMNTARAEQRRQLAEAEALLTGFSDFVIAKLGLIVPTVSERPTFAIRQQDIGNRLDAFFHSPYFEPVSQALAATHTVAIGEVVQFSREVWRPEKHDEPNFRYIEISGVNAATGEASAQLTPTEEAPSRARMAVKPGDLLVSLTRPHHGSIALLPADFPASVASTGFAVLRNFSPLVVPDYVWAVLRTKLGLQQMMQRSSGGNYPAITEAEVAKVRIPLPSLAIQREIAEEVRQRQQQARTLRAVAEAAWEAAKQAFERTLLAQE